MSVCRNIRSFTRRHERLADLFPVLAVVLFFATLWGALEFASPIFEWAKDNLLLHVPLIVLGLAADIFLMFFLLSAGSSTDTDVDESCFSTFKGRRHGGPSLYTAFNNWVQHIEHVGKKHR